MINIQKLTGSLNQYDKTNFLNFTLSLLVEEKRKFLVHV